jgi:tetratricopeptide (TPR) repeat protein
VSEIIQADKDELTEALARYNNATQQLVRPAVNLERIAKVLLARDQIASVADANLEGAARDRLVKADQLLKDLAARSSEFRDGVSQIRSAIRPEDRRWWWHLDDTPASISFLSSVALIVSALFFAVTFALSADIANRFLSGGPDIRGIAGIAVQALLTLVTGSLVTGTARGLVENRLRRRPGGMGKLPYLTLAAAAFIFVLTLGFRLSLAWVAQTYYRDPAFDPKQSFPAKIDMMRRAIALNSEDATSQYDLAFLLEELPDAEGAIDAYKRAIAIDPDYVAAQVALAHAYLSKEPIDLDHAVAIMTRATNEGKFKMEPPEIQAPFYKNWAWCFLRQSDYKNALTNISLCSDAVSRAKSNGTLDKDFDYAELHAIWAEVLESNPRTRAEAQVQWRTASQLLATGNGGDPAPSWMLLIAKHLND